MWNKVVHVLAHIWEWLAHSLKDTVPLLPFILVMYALIELLESKADLRKITKFGTRLGPLVGSATGLIPQCGFSVMAAKLFEQKYITMGTLFAIFMATSDEAFIIMLSDLQTGAMWVLPTLLAKVLIGIAVGYAVDLVMRLVGRRQVCVEMPKTVGGVPTTVHEIFIQRYEQEREVEAECSCGKSHAGQHWAIRYLLNPFLHTLKVGGLILAVNFTLEMIIHLVGGPSVFASFMEQNRFLQPVISCAIGLIPNCASSVVITETFLSGNIFFGTFVAGLCANAGMGFVVILRNVRKWKRNLLMILACYLISVTIGILLNIFPLSV